MPHPDKVLEYRFYLAFLEWFEDSGVDFWSECNAPESLAAIASEISFDIVKPIIEVFLKNGSKEEYEIAYRNYLDDTRI